MNFGSCVRISVCSTQGGRKYMEDRINVHCERKPNGDLEYLFLGVYDGHGGADASHYAKEHLRCAITDHKGFHSNDDESILRAIKDGFLQTHYEMWKKFEHWPKTASGYPSTSGTTASVAIIKKGKVYFGHVGDSAIVIGKKLEDSSVDGSMVTVDHKPDDPVEMKRIEEMGGEVMSKSGVMRVVWTRPSRGHQGPVRRSTSIEKVPFLAVARALGDLWSYNSALDTFVVSPEPDVGVVKLTAEHCCLVLGSDGLWNVIKAQNSIEIVNSHEWRESRDSSVKLPLMQSNHARWLVRHALLRWGNLRADNISVVAVLLDPPESCNEKISGVVAENPYLDIESLLTEYPSALIRITPTKIQLAKTKPVELMYFGASDPTDKTLAMSIYGPRNGFTTWSYQHRNTALTHRGPGYCVYGEERTENWSILPSVFENFLIHPKHSRNFDETKQNFDQETLISVKTAATITVWENTTVRDDNCENFRSATVKKEKICNTNATARVMLVNNRPNVISPENSKKLDGKKLHLIITTPKRQFIVSTPADVKKTSQDATNFVKKSHEITTNFDARKQFTTPKHKRRSASASSATVCPVTCGYYNLRRCSRVTRSGAKLSPKPSTNGDKCQKFRRYSLININLPTAKRHSADGHSIFIKNLHSVPYKLRSTDIEPAKKRPSADADNETSASASAADECLSASFTKRLKLFVDSSTTRFRRE